VSDPTPAAPPPPTQADLLELEEKRLKCDKLRAEIARDRLAWWKQPGYVSSMVPIVIGIVGLLTAWATGFFDRERAHLRAEREQLRADVTTLQQTREGLTAQAKELEGQVREAAATRDRLAGENRKLQRRVDDSYVQLSEGIARSKYTLAHAINQPPFTKDQAARVDAALKGLPPEAAEPIRGALRLIDEMQLIAKWTDKLLEELRARVEQFNPSPWAKELRFDIFGRIIHPDGQRYDPDDPHPERHRAPPGGPVTPPDFNTPPEPSPKGGGK
jgi:hypothetical protein